MTYGMTQTAPAAVSPRNGNGSNEMPKRFAVVALPFGLALLDGMSAPARARRDSEVPLVALAPSDMTPVELAAYQSLGNDPAAQKSFRDTRAFFRLCEQVEAGALQPADLPVEPDDYGGRYVSPSEQKTVKDAIDKAIIAMIKSIHVSQ